MARFFLEISYNGANYNGWQIQDSEPTVQAALNEALSTIYNSIVETTGASRTDTGVHAIMNYAHFDTDAEMPENFLHRINLLLPPDIALNNITQVEDEAHTRFDAIERSYEYRIIFKKDPFRSGFAYHYRFAEPNIELLNKSAEILKSNKDFSSFCKSHVQVKTMICELTQAEWTLKDNGLIVFNVSGNRFLRGMVRGLVGTMLLIGRGKIGIEDLPRIIESKDNTQADFSAPPEGLFLTNIKYPYIEHNG